MTTIEIALQQVEAGDHPSHERALATLLEVWRDTRSRVVADTIDAISLVITAHEPPIVAVGKTSERKAWEDVLRAKRPAAFNRLLEALPHNSHAPERIVDIARLPHDPRISWYAREWLTRQFFLHGENRVPFYKLLLVILRRNDDTRILPALSAITTPSEKNTTIHRMGLPNWEPTLALRDYLADVLEKQKESGNATLAPNDSEMLRRIEDLITTAKPKNATVTTDPRELFARVYANPDDDEPRAVLSDLLQQLGDPRGEFIALQLARHGSKKKRTPRERELMTHWGVTWLGPLAKYVYQGADEFEFERGFPASVRLVQLSHETTVFEPLEEWSTITTLNIRDRVGERLVKLLTSPEMRSLRHVLRFVSGADLRMFYTEKKALPWKTLGVGAFTYDHVPMCLEGPQDVFGCVTRLIIEGHETNSLTLLSAEQVNIIIQKWPALEQLDIQPMTEQAARILAGDTFRRLDRLVITIFGLTIVVTKAEPKLLHLTVTDMSTATTTEQGIANLLGLLFKSPGLARSGFDRVHISADGHVKVANDALVHGRWQKLDLTAIRRITRDAGVELTLLKEK